MDDKLVPRRKDRPNKGDATQGGAEIAPDAVSQEGAQDGTQPAEAKDDGSQVKDNAAGETSADAAASAETPQPPSDDEADSYKEQTDDGEQRADAAKAQPKPKKYQNWGECREEILLHNSWESGGWDSRCRPRGRILVRDAYHLLSRLGGSDLHPARNLYDMRKNSRGTEGARLDGCDMHRAKDLQGLRRDGGRASRTRRCGMERDQASELLGDRIEDRDVQTMRQGNCRLHPHPRPHSW